MAETAVRTKTKLGWAKSGMESSSDDEDAIVPGVNKTGSSNLRPRVRPRHRRDVRSKVSQQPATAEDVPSTTTLSVQDLSQSLDERRLGPTAGGKRSQVSLKDLCVEDKRRIANLIRELAKVGEEREKAREDLEKERRNYEQQILKLVEQQEQILRERQEVEKHLQECQQLLAQSQPLHPPPPSRPASLPHPPLSTGITIAPPPPPSFPVPPYPYAWSEGEGRDQEFHQSLLGNVGSPDRQTGHPAGPYPQPHMLAASVPAPSHPVHNNQAHPHPSQLPNHPAYSHSHPHHAAGDPAPHPSHPPGTHPPHHLSPHPAYTHPLPHTANSRPPQKPPASDFFANVMQQSEPLDVFASKGAPSHPALLNIQTSKEEVIERFFASQPADHEPQLVSPKRRDVPRKPSQPRPSNHQQLFPKPRMSSTQKSAEIKDYLSVDSEFVPLVPDESSVTSGGDGGGRRREEEKGDGVSRVMFHEGRKEELHMHSPLGDAGDDARTAHNYRKMSQTQRKEQLLQQRALLLEEQHRLKHILTEQEAMLNEKQRALQARSRHRHGNNVDDDDNGDGEGGDVNGDDDDPLGLIPQRLAIDAALERQRAIVDNLEMEAKQRVAINSKPTTTTTTTTTSASRPTGGVLPQQERKGREKEGSGKKEKREKGGETFVVHNQQLSDIVRKLDYSLHSDTEVMEEDRESERASNSDDEDDDKENVEAVQEGQSPPSAPALRQEASTSMSFRTIPRSSHGGKENVLDDGGEGDHHPPPAFSSPSLQTHTPGEKTMSVLEIINSLPSPRPADTAILAPRLSPCTQEFSPLHQQHRDSSPLSRWRGKEDYDVEIVVMDSSEDDDDDVHDDDSDIPNNEELEESQILEDIFFLK